jgi:hypothetical protein
VSFGFRALELHGRHIWQRDSIMRALEVIQRNCMTALVLHETDLVQMVTYPRAYLDPYGLWQSAPTRRGENAIENNRVYLAHVCRLAAKAGVELYVETKEIGFPDEILELHPELLKNGLVCPSEPFWTEFIERKTDEFFADFPDIAGMISSAGSTEGKASRAQNKCGCALCRQTSLQSWYSGIIGALHRAATRRGRTLAVRDFAYKPSDHETLIRAVEQAPSDIVFCVKATPHDFYPTFPHNPAIARAKRRLWVEYDTMGQFYGWGLFPCLVLDDLRARMAHAARHGAEGISFRIEWDRINDYWSLDTLNEMNLIAGATLARGDDVDIESICRRWLDEHGQSTKAAPFLASLMADTWDVIRGALYLDGFVFADNSMFPRSLRRAWWGMEVRDALHTWDPARAPDLQMSRARVEALLAEKQRAVRLAASLAQRARAGEDALPPDLHGRLVCLFDRTETYVRGFALCAEVCVRARWNDPAHRTDAGPEPGDHARFEQAIEELDSFATGLLALAAKGDLPHQFVMLMDANRLADIVREARATIDAAPFDRMTL